MALGLPARWQGTRDNATRLSLRALREKKLATRDVLEGGKEDLLENRDLVGRHEERSESQAGRVALGPARRRAPGITPHD